MMGRLNGKGALITGGTTGIGLETARQFKNEGACVAIIGTNPQRLEEAREQLGTDVLVLSSDASDIESQKLLAEQVVQSFGGLDVLFINAGIVDMRPIEKMDAAGFERSFAINVKVLPALANPASIVLNASVNAHIGMPNTSVYVIRHLATCHRSELISAPQCEAGCALDGL
jgi:NAD(P)-dependent dehydrogenase (short-subunit alcohol dehydrogenase family)